MNKKQKEYFLRLAKDIGAFRKEENKYDFDIVVYYTN